MSDEPSPAMISGIIHPGPGQRFAPGAKITGPGVVHAEVNPDGSANVTWADGLTGPTLSIERGNDGPIFQWAKDASYRHWRPRLTRADTSGMLIDFDESPIPARLRYPNARCPIAPLHLVHTWGDPPHWCDAQPLPDAEPD